MRRQFRILTVGIAATLVLGTMPACSGGSGREGNSAAPSVVDNFPKSAHYIADMPMADGKTMTIGVAVEGDKVAAYACDAAATKRGSSVPRRTDRSTSPPSTRTP